MCSLRLFLLMCSEREIELFELAVARRARPATISGTVFINVFSTPPAIYVFSRASRGLLQPQVQRHWSRR